MVIILMAEILGGSLGYWAIYALLALAFKHRLAFVIMSILSLASSVLVTGDFLLIISSILTIVFISCFAPLQVKSKKKEEWKQLHKK